MATVFEFLAIMDAHCGTPDKQIAPMLEAAVQEELADFLAELVYSSRHVSGQPRHPPDTADRRPGVELGDLWSGRPVEPGG